MQRHLTYRPGAAPFPVPDTTNRSYEVTAHILAPGNGVLVAVGGSVCGFVLYVEGGLVTYHHQASADGCATLTADAPLGGGPSTVTLSLLFDGGGPGRGAMATLFIDGRMAAEQRVGQTEISRMTDDRIAVGGQAEPPVAAGHPVPSSFDGVIDRVDIELGHPGLDEEEEQALHPRFLAGRTW